MAKQYRVRNSKKGFEVHASGGPVDDPTQARELFYSLGLVAATWARMELMLDAFLMRVNKASELAELYDPEHPVSFKRKVKLAKKWLCHPKLLPHREVFRDALDILLEMSNSPDGKSTSRNELLHSDYRHFDSASGDFVIANVKSIGKDRFRLKEAEHNLADIDELIHKCRMAALSVSELLDLLDQPKT